MGYYPCGKLETFSKLLTEHCKQCCAPLLPDGELTILLISEDGKYMYEKALMIMYMAVAASTAQAQSPLSFMQRRESELPASTESTLAVIRE